MGRGRNIIAALFVGATLTATPKIEAQDSPLGFWFGLGVGTGWQLDEPVAGLTSFGGAFSLKFGGTPARWLRVGGEALMWGSNSEGIERGRGNLMAIGQAYPIANAGLFVKVGIGVAAAITEGNVTGTRTASGFGPGLGVGYEFQPGGSLLIAVAADWLIQVIDVGQGTSTTSFALFTVGIGTR